MKTLYNERKYEALFILYFTLMFMANQLGYSSGDVEYKITLGIAVIFLLLKLFYTSYNSKQWIMVITLITISILAILLNKKIALLFTVLTIFTMKEVSIERLFEYVLRTQFIVFGVNIIKYLRAGGPIDHTVRMNSEGIFEDIERSSLGFVHANALHGWLTIVYCLIIFLKYKNLKSYNYFLMFMISMGFYAIDKSRSGLITSLLLLFLAFILPKIQNNRMLRNLIIFSPGILSVGMIITIYLYDAHFFIVDKLNILLMNRVKFSSEFLHNYPPKIFGSETVNSINGSIIDSGFAELYIRYGVFFFILITICNILLCKKTIENKDYAALAIIIVFQYYNLTEPFGVNIFSNISYIFVNKYLIMNGSPINSQKEHNSGKKKTRLLNYGA